MFTKNYQAIYTKFDTFLKTKVTLIWRLWKEPASMEILPILPVSWVDYTVNKILYRSPPPKVIHIKFGNLRIK